MFKPFEHVQDKYLRLIMCNSAAHAKFSSANFHTPADHEAVTRFKDMKGARNVGKTNCTDKDRYLT